jgi:hypothetical protein
MFFSLEGGTELVFLALRLEFVDLLFSDEMFGIFNHSSNIRIWSDQLSIVIYTRPTLNPVSHVQRATLNGIWYPSLVPSLSRVGLKPCTYQVLVYTWTYSSKLALSFYCCAPWLLEWYAVIGRCSIHLVWWTQTDWTVKHQVERRYYWGHLWTFEGSSLW